MKVVLLLCVTLFTGVEFVAAQTDCAVSETALAELEDLKALVDQLAALVETIIGSPIPEPPFVIIDPTITVAWNEVTVSWTIPEGAIGFIAQVIADGVAKPIVRLPPVADSFTTTDIETGIEHTIKITPIKGDGPGTEYITDPFTPECPAICPLIFAPVCGTDGNTYSSECDFEVAQCESEDAIEIAKEGPCETDPCDGIQCYPLECGDGYTSAVVEGECCPICQPIVYMDCTDAMESGITVSGVYTIQPTGAPTPFTAYCDMETDGGKWTVILRRVNSTINFDRTYEEYVNGFGDLEGAFWAGLEKFYLLNQQGNVEVLVQMVDQRDTAGAAKYRKFRISGADTNYRLDTVATFTENVAGFPEVPVGNALYYNRGAAFSARDQDNDLSARNCAAELVGGWWYKGGMCSRSNPLGEYLGEERVYERGVLWAPFRGKQHSLKSFEMKVRRPSMQG